MRWDGDVLYADTRKLLELVPDKRWPGMWRIRYPDGRLSDMLNRSWANDTACVIAARDDFPDQAHPATMPNSRTIVVLISETSISRFSACLADGAELVHSSRAPFLAACRKLIDLGHDPDEIAVMRYHGSDVDCLTARIGDAAQLTIEETRKTGPRFVLWKPFAAWTSTQGSRGEGDPVSDTGDD